VTGITYSNSSVSFFTDCNDANGRRGLTTALPPSFNVNPTIGGRPLVGWPILPHGAGAYYNLYGTYIDIPQTGRPWTYGEFIPCEEMGGEIVSVGANYLNSGNTTYELYVCNYTAQQQTKVGDLLAFNQGSLCWAVPLGNGIPIPGPGDYIGLFVFEPNNQAGVRAPTVLVEGTIYFQLKSPP